MNTSDYWKSLRARRAKSASVATPQLRLTDSPVRLEPVQTLLHRWIPNRSRWPDLDAFAILVAKMPPSRPIAYCQKRGARAVFASIGGCWIFRGSSDHEYPLFRVPSSESWEAAYLWLYAQLHGELDADALIDHKCENKRCVNPDHLERVSGVAENVKKSKDRKKDREG